jgi:hypothetical protein
VQEVGEFTPAVEGSELLMIEPHGVNRKGPVV